MTQCEDLTPLPVIQKCNLPTRSWSSAWTGASRVRRRLLLRPSSAAPATTTSSPLLATTGLFRTFSGLAHRIPSTKRGWRSSGGFSSSAMPPPASPHHLAVITPFARGTRRGERQCTYSSTVIRQRYPPPAKYHFACFLFIAGCTSDSFYCTLQGIYLLLSAGADLAAEDNAGDSPFTSLRTLITRGLHTEVIVLAHLLIRHQQQQQQQQRHQQTVDRLVNHSNFSAGRTLLTYSAECGDESAGLTRLLLNAGARVWTEAEEGFGTNDVADRVAKELEGSALTWFLRALLRRRGSDHLAALSTWGDGTLHLLGHAAAAISDQGGEALRDHLTRAVLRLGRSERAEGPVFAEVRRRLAPLWAQPLSLKFLCLRRIRGTIGPKNLSDAGGLKRKLSDIPNTMLQYLQLA